MKLLLSSLAYNSTLQFHRTDVLQRQILSLKSLLPSAELENPVPLRRSPLSSCRCWLQLDTEVLSLRSTSASSPWVADPCISPENETRFLALRTPCLELAVLPLAPTALTAPTEGSAPSSKNAEIPHSTETALAESGALNLLLVFRSTEPLCDLLTSRPKVSRPPSYASQTCRSP